MPDDTEDSLPPNGTANTSEGEASTDKIKEALAAKDSKIEELTDTIRRIQAEFENYKKRVDREWAERSRLAGESIVVDLLAVLDTLDKALAETNADSDLQGDGIDGIRRQFLQTLRRAGLKEIPTDGPFDPFMHEALMREETESGDVGRILEVFQKGYMLGPKVIRAARVKVSVGASPVPPGEASGGSSENEDEQVDDGQD